MKTSEQVMCNDEALELVKEMQATQGETSNEQKMADLLRFTCYVSYLAGYADCLSRKASDSEYSTANFEEAMSIYDKIVEATEGFHRIYP